MKNATPSSPGRRRLRVAVLALSLGLGGQAFSSSEAHADQVSTLSKRLDKSKSAKARIAAAVSLGRLKDKRALKPLVLALRDENMVVRAVAASSLGGLGDSRALPALRRATRDKDKTVRKRATEAIGLIRKNASNAANRKNDRYTVKSRKIRSAYYRVGGKESPKLAPLKPDLFVSVRSAADDSKGRVSRKVRKAREASMKELMLAELKNTSRLTTNEGIAQEYGLDKYGVDLSITRLKRVTRGPWVEMECELRIAISNDRGKMISFLTGGAKVQVAKKTFRKEFEDNMRKEALEGAVKSVHQDLARYLIKNLGA